MELGTLLARAREVPEFCAQFPTKRHVDSPNDARRTTALKAGNVGSTPIGRARIEWLQNFDRRGEAVGEDVVRREDFRAVRRNYRLPSKEESKRAVAAILNGRVEEWVDRRPQLRVPLEKVDAAYRQKVAALGSAASPRLLALIRVAQDQYPSLRIREIDGHLEIDSYFRGLRPNLLSLLMGLVPPSQLHLSAQHSSPRDGQAFHGKFSPFEQALGHAGAVCASPRSRALLRDWFDEARRGCPVTVVSPVCPDYAWAKTTDGQARYTFDGLNSGIGLVATRLYASVPAIHGCLSRLISGESFTHFAVLTDFEGFSHENLRRVGLSPQEFFERLRGSLEALRVNAPDRLQVLNLSDVCGGKEEWLRLLAETRRRIDLGEFDDDIRAMAIRDIASARMSFYRRWFQKRQLDVDFVHALVLYQCAEYSTGARILEKAYPNALLLGVGNPKMLRLHEIGSHIPVLCLCDTNL